MTLRHLSLSVALVTAAAGSLLADQKAAPAPPAPIVVLDTAKGVIEIQLFPEDAPKSVAHVVALARKGFYRGQRFHRVERTLVQVGDPQTRDMSRSAYWGTAGSGKPIGAPEFSKKRNHVRGTVALAHPGDARFADSQFYIMKTAQPQYDGKYTIIGQVVRGMEVVDKLQVPDVIKNVTVK
jgi:cyclophilin family peptidyl-prolyl cis-trans isomerase